MAKRSVEVVHVGSASRDIADDDPRGWRLGGGVTYAALTTARLGLRTAAVVGGDAAVVRSHELELLRDSGVDVLAVELAESPVFVNTETPTGRRQTAVAVGVPVDPIPLPGSWLDSRAWSLVPVADEVPDAWVDRIAPDATVAVAWQGMLRRLVAGGPVERIAPRARAMLRRADIVGLSHHDVPIDTTLDELARFVHPGARLLVTQGGNGGLLVATGPDGPAEVLRYLPTRTDREIDPTGAGDTFLASLLAALIRPGLAGAGRRSTASALRFAAAAGSLAVEGVGLAGVPNLTEVRVRRARERVRRAVLPSEAAQVGVEGPGS